MILIPCAVLYSAEKKGNKLVRHGAGWLAFREQSSKCEIAAFGVCRRRRPRRVSLEVISAIASRYPTLPHAVLAAFRQSLPPRLARSLGCGRCHRFSRDFKLPRLRPTERSRARTRNGKMGCGASKDAQREAEYQTALQERNKEQEKVVAR